MLYGYLGLRKLRCYCKRKLFIMSSLTVGIAFSVYTLILVGIAGVSSGRLDLGAQSEVRAGANARHHNRILQNSAALASDETRYQAQFYHNAAAVKSGSANNLYPIFDKPEDGLSNRYGSRSVDQVDDNSNNNVVFTDDEDIFKAHHRKPVRVMDSLAAGGNRTKHLPQALIIGVKKAGTRALLEYLRMHPDVKAPGPEPHFFDKNYKKGLEWYRNLMPEATPGQTVMEKTPSYFVTRSIPERVHKMSTKTKLILVLRDPVTRAISDYTQLASRNPNVRPFEELAFVNNRTKIINTSWTIIKIGVYARHLARWLEYFPLRQIHFVNAEKLIKSPAEEIRKVQEFLGLEQFVSAENFTFNHTKGFPCYRKDTTSQKWHCLNDEKGRHHPNIDSTVTRLLRQFYRPFNLQLYKMTGQDFGWT